MQKIRNSSEKRLTVLGAELEGSFSKQQIASQLEAEDVQDPKIQEIVHEAILGLKPAEVDRLLYVGNLQATCEYTKPSRKTQQYIEIDHQLQKKGLVTLEPDLKTYKAVKNHGEYSDQGLPISCYQMKLTEQGYNVKTGLAKTLGAIVKSIVTNPRLAMK